MLKLVASQCMESLGSGQWQCTVCGLVRGKKDLRRHIEAKHLENTSVSCQKCTRTFKTRDSRRKHLCEFDLEQKNNSVALERGVHISI